MDFRILGPLEVQAEAGPLPLGGTKQRAVLAILLLHPNQVVSTDRLIEGLWGEQPPNTAAKALQVRVSRLRKLLEPERVIITRPPGYLIELEPDEFDLMRFESLRAEAAAARASGNAGEAHAKLQQALSLWRGPPLADFTYEPFAQAEIARLEELRHAAVEDRIEADLARGSHAEVIGELEGLIDDHPLRERLRGQLMLALYRSKRQAEALEAYRDARRALVDELGIEPSRELQALEQAVLQQDPSLDLISETTPAGDGGEGDAVESRRTDSFVGREHELGGLLASLDDALSGHGRVVLIGGEPGIGKTRLAEELARHGRGRGARVLTGRCWDAGGAPAYWPWIQVLRSYLRVCDPDDVRAQLGGGASAVAQIAPELREIMPDIPPPPSLESEGARFRLFDATTSFLMRAATARPLVLVLDDLHAADMPSLLLLQFLAGELGDAGILVLGTYRDAEPDVSRSLASALLELQRQRVTRRLPLAGLSESDVAELIALTADLHPSESLAAAIHEQTDGNPLFVDEVVQLLSAEGRLAEAGSAGEWSATIPESAREVIGRRLRRLPDDCNEALTLAAALGREFTLETLARISEWDNDRVMDVLDEAISARVVDESPSARGRFRFSHGLTRDVLYDGISPGRRMRLHRRIGEALELLYEQDPDPHLAEMCHHFVEAAPSGDSGKALDYARRAGDRAGMQLAYEEAIRHYAMALEVQDRVAPVGDDARCDLLLAMGDAQMRAGAGPDAKESFLTAAGIARSAGAPERLARAALGYGGRFVWSRAGGDQHLVPLLEEALAVAADGDSPIRARLLARLSGALRDPPFRQRAASLSQESVEMARRIGDPAALGYALDARHVVIWGPDSAEERAAITKEITRLAEQAEDRERAFEGRFWHVEAYLEVGDLDRARAELEAAAVLAEELRQPAQLWYVAVTRALLALFEGELDKAGGLIERALALGQQAQSLEAIIYYRLQMFGLRSAQGRLEELEEVLARSIEEYPGYWVFRCALANLYCELGQAERCSAVFEELAADDFAELPRDEEWLFGMSLLAPVCDLLSDGRRAASLHELLSPYGDRNTLSVPDLSIGAVSRPLGVLAGTIGRFDEAASHFEDALRMNADMGALPWLARTQHDYFRMLVARNDPGDRDRGRQLLALAIDGYKRLGMKTWAERAAAELAAAPR
jgi:DNA-binding SARP family transcriptional activator/tetratricopeptide (TPR) repeat protein